MYVRVEVRPGAKRESVIETDGKTLTIAVKEKAQRGQATARVRAIVAEYFSVSPAKVRIISGHRSPRKIFDIPD